MLTPYRYQDLGSANYGWLKARHHFSFAHYYNPARMGFGKLRVVNDDWVEPGRGFDPHPHQNMEIITYVRSGEIVHQDNTGNKGVTKAGEVQVMSAGHGIIHSEYNLSKDPLTLYQIWIETKQNNVSPRWESKTFPKHDATSDLALLVSGDKRDKDALFIYQDAKIYGGNIQQQHTLNHNLIHQGYFLVSKGEVIVRDGNDSVRLTQGDACEIINCQQIQIEAIAPSEVLIIDVPA
ncbi:pirin family protein [Thalassotalea aquiviva]|uniref:pirin family protein n=1 Tax=Thalassotalea aquiviva TaxID=3242415 RepID=UPI003529E2FF